MNSRVQFDAPECSGRGATVLESGLAGRAMDRATTRTYGIQPERMCAMREIARKYEGTSTARGHEIRVDHRPGEVELWYRYRGELDGVHGGHHMGIARVQKQADVYIVGWLRGTAERAYESQVYWDIHQVYGSLDKIIALR